MAALLAFPFAGVASDEIILTAPYPRADSTGQGVANRETGLISALSLGAFGGQVVGGGTAWVGIDHRLTDDASAIDYTILLTKNATIDPRSIGSSPDVYVWATASINSVHDSTEVPITPGPQALSLTLSAPEGSSFRAGSVANLSVGVKAVTSSCPVIGSGCQTLELRYITVGVAQAVVNSVVATTHPAGPEPTPTPTTPFELEATGYKDKGLQKADLIWSGASSSSVDVYRDGIRVATTDNDGAFTDQIDRRGKGTYTYRVCETGTSTCSNEAVVEF